MAATLPRGRSAATPKTTAPPAKGSVLGDNFGDEAERIQLISIVSQLSAADDEIEEARAPLKAAQKKRSRIIGLGKAAGFTAKELERRLDEMRVGTRENATLAAREYKHRRWLGIIEPDQSSLLTGSTAPQEAKDEAHWKGEGYKAGLRQLTPKPPSECPERFTQAWMAEYHRGLKEVAMANAPKQAPPTVREQAAADFVADNGPEAGTPEAQAAERAAVRRAKESLDGLGDSPLSQARAELARLVETDAEEGEIVLAREKVEALEAETDKLREADADAFDKIEGAFEVSEEEAAAANDGEPDASEPVV